MKKKMKKSKSWTKFWDMHSGGGSKEKWEMIYIEAPKDEAIVIFYNRFRHNPKRVTCTCCGEDYAIESDRDLSQLTGYHRNCKYVDGKYVTKPNYQDSPAISLKDYLKSPEVKVIYAKDIKPEEREGDVPAQGYVWVD